MTRRFLQILAVAMMALLALASCAPSLPTDGPVGTAEAPAAADYDYARDPVPPQDGMAPDDVLQGFLQAGAGPQNDYEVAREYLTEDAAAEWQPDDRVFVYASDISIINHGDGVMSVEVPVDRHIDGNGSMTRPGSTESITYELEEDDDGEWRITSAPPGKILDAGTFDAVYSEYTLYFYDPQERYAVPDLRWFVNRPGLPAEMASRILAGPAPWLEEGVMSSFGADASMGNPSVPVDEQVATVDLEADVVANASDRDIALMHHQLNMSLSQLSTVRETELTVNGSELDVPEPGDLSEDQQLDIETNPVAEETQVAVQDDTIVRQTGRSTNAVPGLPDISDLGPRFPAVPNDPSELVFSFMDEDLEELYHVRPENEEPELLVESENMTRPSMDNFGWTWTVTHDGDDPTIQAFDHDNPQETASASFSADFLEGTEVTSLRISQDGTRAALIVDDAGVRTLYIASVVRDGSTGAPRGLGGQYQLNAQVEMEEVRWAENDSVVVWQPWEEDEDDDENGPPEASEIQRILLSGVQLDPEESVIGLLNVSVGEGQSNTYIEQEDTGVHTQVGDGWQIEPEMEITDLSYSG